VILNTAQRVLEECCFEFAKERFPSVFEEHEWDCAAAVELNRWAHVLDAQMPASDTGLKGASLGSLLLSANKLRHTSVHRIRITSLETDQLVEAAARLAEALHGRLRAPQLEKLHRKMRDVITATELHSTAMESVFNAKLQGIRRLRARLDKKENDLLSSLPVENMKKKALTGQLLEESVRSIFEENRSIERS